MYIKYNDYELLYLIDEGSEEAYLALVDKYMYLIKQKIVDFKIKPKYREDYIQEGLLTLEVAIRKFNEFKGKSFMRYYELLLVRRFQKVLAQEKEYFYNVTLVEYPDMLREDTFRYYNASDEYLELGFSDLEAEVLNYLALGYKPADISRVTKYDIKKVYNTILRIKIKFNKGSKD